MRMDTMRVSEQEAERFRTNNRNDMTQVESLSDGLKRAKFANITNCIEQLKFKFGLGKPFSPSKDDLFALNGIIDYVNDRREKTLRNNQLYAKLFIYTYGLVLKHFKATPFDEAPEFHMRNLLLKDMDVIVSEFVSELNFDDFAKKLELIGVDFEKHPALKSEAERHEFLRNFKSLPDEEKKAFFQTAYDHNTIVDILNSMISKTLEYD